MQKIQKFELKTKYKLSLDQKNAVEKILKYFGKNLDFQTLW
jgi:excinuclease UvrABC helicase subunit UvrB